MDHPTCKSYAIKEDDEDFFAANLMANVKVDLTERAIRAASDLESFREVVLATVVAYVRHLFTLYDKTVRQLHPVPGDC